MSQPNNIKDREHSKFIDSPKRDNQSAVEVVDSSNRFAADPRADYIERIVAGSVETFNYRQGGAAGLIVKTVVVTYTTSSLNNLVSVAVTFELPL
jgi:hypothetical protein